MRISYLKRFAAVFFFVLVGIFSAQSALGQDEDWRAHQLEGSWIVQVSLQNCSLGTPIGAPFLSLLTFARGGTMTETTANPMFFPAERGPGHGIWKYSAPGTYEATTTAFITVNGVLTRTQTIAQTIELVGEDSFKTMSASVKFFSPTGTLLGAGCATASGKRIEF